MENFTTTFWMDFTIADAFGEKAIKDTFRRAFTEWKENYRYLTDLVMVLNHKIWQHYVAGNTAYGTLYDQLWSKAEDYAFEHLTGDELKYFLEVTD